MLSPLDILLDPVSLTLLGVYVSLMIWEALFPARKLPGIPYWHAKGILAFALFFFLSSYLPYLYADLLPKTQLIDFSGMNVAAGALLGILLYELGLYVWHRSLHTSNILWRMFHQVHHSAERLDTYGAFFFSPLDMFGFASLGIVCFSVILGLPPQAVTISILTTNFLAIFQHANVKTPTWLGYFIQRPESHAVHHGKGIHAYNYSDLPVFDIMFGTFRNPSKYVAETGFYEGASSKMLEMLSFKDVSKKD